MASSGLSASTAAPPILPSSSDPLPAASTSISKLALPTQPLPLPQDAKVPSPLLAYHQNLAAHLVTLIQANTTRSPNKLSSRSFPEKQLCKSSLPPSLPPSKHARHAALPPPTLPENPRQKSDSSLESTAITTEVGTDSAGSGLASKVSSLSTAPTSLRSASAGIIGDSKQKEAQRTSPTGRIAVAGPAASGPVAPQLEQAHQRTQCSARISHPSGYVHPTSISRSNSLTDSLTLDLTARPDHLARFSPLLLPECGADANADVSASAVAGPSRSARPSQPTLDRHSTSGVQDLPRASHTSHREYANEYESASEEEHGDTHHHAQARSIASDAETREEEHRKAWETEGRHVWKVIPNGFELKLQQGSKQSKRASGEYKSTDKEECQRAPSGPSSVRGRTQLGDSVTKRSQRLSMGQPSPPDEGYLGVGRGGDHVATSISACSNTRDRDQDVSRPGSTSISEFDSQGGPSRPQSRAQQLREPYQVPYHTGLGIILPDQIQSSLSALDPGPTNQARDRDVKSSSQQKLRVVNPDQDECEGPTRKQANGDEGVGRQHRDRDRNHSGSEAGDVERSGGNDDHEDLASKEYKAKRDEKLKKKGAVLRLRVVKWWQEVMDATPDMGSIAPPPPIEPSLPSPSLVKSLLRFPQLASISDLYPAVPTSAGTDSDIVGMNLNFDLNLLTLGPHSSMERQRHHSHAKDGDMAHLPMAVSQSQPLPQQQPLSLEGLGAPHASCSTKTSQIPSPSVQPALPKGRFVVLPSQAKSTFGHTSINAPSPPAPLVPLYR